MALVEEALERQHIEPVTCLAILNQTLVLSIPSNDKGELVKPPAVQPLQGHFLANVPPAVTRAICVSVIADLISPSDRAREFTRAYKGVFRIVWARTMSTVAPIGHMQIMQSILNDEP